MNYLLADIGGTNTRCANTGSDWRPGQARTFINREHESLTALLGDFIDGLEKNGRPQAGVLAIAAPVSGDHVHMTNMDWDFSLDAIRDELGLRELRALNDFEALAWALPDLQADDLQQIGAGRAVADKPKGVIGPGTGLGVASLVPSGERWLAVPGEGGHVTLPATDHREAAAIAKIRQDFGHCSAERVISGPGIGLLHRALHGGPDTDAAEVSRLAAANDEAAIDTLDVFFRLLGTVAANLALTIGAFGGIYIGGGVVPRHRERFAASGFRERFEAKGRYGDYLRTIPTHLIVSPQPALTGLAAFAKQHAPNS
jgi:glucokinase